MTCPIHTDFLTVVEDVVDGAVEHYVVGFAVTVEGVDTVEVVFSGIC